MIRNPNIPLQRLVLSLSEALDHVSPSVANHQLRVAYMALRVARHMGYAGEALRDVFHAAALHDIGLVRAENRIRAVAASKLEGLAWHGPAGCELLQDNPFFAAAGPIVRHHHAAWDRDGEAVPIESYILAIADVIDRSIDPDTPILRQREPLRERVRVGRGRHFHPDCADAFFAVSQTPAFWLDATSPRVYAILKAATDLPALVIDETAVESIARIFARLVDSLSPWTGTHSAGVTATAVALAERLNFSPREQVLMRAAGYLHDLGKIAIPAAILDKPDSLSPDERAIVQTHTYYTFRILETIGGMPQISEWAAFHHERLDGTGYPFGHDASALVLGARVMAVADVLTAVTEDRPYRPGMDEERALAVLGSLVDNGGLDGEVVAVLRREFDAIDATRREEQAAYALQQARLAELIEAPAPAGAGR